MFADTLPTFVVDVHAGRGERSEAKAKLLGDETRSVLGEEGSSKLEAFVNNALALHTAKVEDKEALSTSRTAYVNAGNDLNAHLDAQGLPFYIDANTWPTKQRLAPLPLSFYIEREETVRSGENEVRAVHLWRLDRLNLYQSYLGYTRPDTPVALVLLDQIESQLVRYVLPALPDDESLTLVDVKTEVKKLPWAEELAVKAATLMRKHYRHVKIDNIDAAVEVGRLLARRRTLITQIRKEISEQGALLEVPKRLIPEGDYADALSYRVPRAWLVEWDDIHDELVTHDNLRAFVSLRAHYVASVQRHEVQHRLDYQTSDRPIPDALARSIGRSSVEEGGRYRRLGERARDELSAYLATLALAPESPLLDLILLTRFIFDRSSNHGGYWYAALVAMQGIGGELEIDVDRVLGRGTIRRERAAQLLYAIGEHSVDDIRSAALRFYETAFGHPPPQVDAVSAKDNAHWRH